MKSARLLFALAVLLGLIAVAHAQERPLERTFVAGETRRYRVEISVRTEVEGHQTEKIGVKTYVTPAANFAEASLSWQAARRIAEVGSDGTAAIEEALDGFGEVRGQASGPDAEPLLAALKSSLSKWGTARVLRYEETQIAQLRGVELEGAPGLDEATPQVLTPWILRALRPAASLTGKPLKFNQRWQEPREVRLPNWSDAQGTESGEWMEAPAGVEPAAQLHIVQQISGTVAPTADQLGEGAGQGSFHGESLSTVSLADGRVIAATRSATREVIWTLARVEGLPEAPRFRGRLSVQIRIEEIE